MIIYVCTFAPVVTASLVVVDVSRTNVQLDSSIEVKQHKICIYGVLPKHSNTST